MKIKEGQCGLCAHFGESEPQQDKLVEIRRSKDAPLELKEECGHPTHAKLHLMVTPTSGCDAFTPAGS